MSYVFMISTKGQVFRPYQSWCGIGLIGFKINGPSSTIGSLVTTQRGNKAGHPDIANIPETNISTRRSGPIDLAGGSSAADTCREREAC